jgi:hypothetical protein
MLPWKNAQCANPASPPGFLISVEQPIFRARSSAGATHSSTTKIVAGSSAPRRPQLANENCSVYQRPPMMGSRTLTDVRVLAFRDRANET